jgi:HSP20 family protein
VKRRRRPSPAEARLADAQIGFLPAAPFSPVADVMETHDEYVIVLEVAGADDREFDLAIDGTRLVVRGLRPEHSQGKRRYHASEIRTGPFERVVTLPGPVHPEDTRARYERGLLRITVRKASSSKDDVLRL